MRGPANSFSAQFARYICRHSAILVDEFCDGKAAKTHENACLFNLQISCSEDRWACVEGMSDEAGYKWSKRSQEMEGGW